MHAAAQRSEIIDVSQKRSNLCRRAIDLPEHAASAAARSKP
jgi:hypothetical protein